ncbi:MAG TPA: bile acid:sodium symporter [Casimicrobiaceae bacterium]|nr:bile acid:sodium symporter [Casimicrobiaceae bacterium]
MPPLDGPVPDWLLSSAAAATLFVIMFDIGLAVAPIEFRWVIERPGLVLRALFSVVVTVPAIAWMVARALDMPRDAEIGIMLMAIAPGAPVALRRALDAGGHRAFAPALQLLLAILAIASVPLWIDALDEYYASSVSIDPVNLARQVFFAQLLPLCLGAATRRAWDSGATWIEPRLRTLGSLLLIALVMLVLADVWKLVVVAGARVAVAVVAVTLLALAVGHALGGPDTATRTSTAISSAARNTGLALLVATLNKAAPGIIATVLAYFLLSALTVIPYVIWRRRATQPAMT